MSFTIYPAIDVREGRVVRLRQGDYAQETRYASDPLALAKSHADAGAQWLHLVDLDAARVGGGTLRPLIECIARETSLKIQTGGGVRSVDDALRLLDAGATRVVVGTVAVRAPDEILAWLTRLGSERLTIALDARQDSDVEGGGQRLAHSGKGGDDNTGAWKPVYELVEERVRRPRPAHRQQNGLALVRVDFAREIELPVAGGDGEVVHAARVYRNLRPICRPTAAPRATAP